MPILNIFKAGIGWWEKKRPLYTITLIIVALLFVGARYSEISKAGSKEFSLLVFGTILIANLFYTVGWVIECLLYYCFNIPALPNWLRIAMLATGTIVSVLVEVLLFNEYIYPFIWQP